MQLLQLNYIVALRWWWLELRRNNPDKPCQRRRAVEHAFGHRNLRNWICARGRGRWIKQCRRSWAGHYFISDSTDILIGENSLLA